MAKTSRFRWLALSSPNCWPCGGTGETATGRPCNCASRKATSQVYSLLEEFRASSPNHDLISTVWTWAADIDLTKQITLTDAEAEALDTHTKPLCYSAAIVLGRELLTRGLYPLSSYFTNAELSAIMHYPATWPPNEAPEVTDYAN